MKREEFLPYLNKFITVTLDDGTEESGYIANPDTFRGDEDDVSISLLNGLFSQEVPVSRIVSVRRSVREDTVKIPIVGFESEDPQETEDREAMDAMLDDLYEKSLLDMLDIDLDSLLKNNENSES